MLFWKSYFHKYLWFSIFFMSLVFISFLIIYDLRMVEKVANFTNFSKSKARKAYFFHLREKLHSFENVALQKNNLTSYKYIINEPDKCSNNTPFLVLMITSRVEEMNQRKAIRETWGNEDVPGVSIVRLFMLGTKDGLRTAPIGLESLEYHDIIQQDFLDTYRNLTLKTLMGINWVSTYCPNANYVMKTDSDMFVNVEHLVNRLLKPDQPPKRNYFTGYLMKNGRPIRNENSKWYMPHDLYPSNQYPDFCSGTGYVFSGDLAVKIVKASVSVRFIHLEDVFVGACLEKEGIAIMPPPSNSLFNTYKVEFEPCRYYNLITSHWITPEELVIFWDRFKRKREDCMKMNGDAR